MANTNPSQGEGRAARQETANHRPGPNLLIVKVTLRLAHSVDINTAFFHSYDCSRVAMSRCLLWLLWFVIVGKYAKMRQWRVNWFCIDMR